MYEAMGSTPGTAGKKKKNTDCHNYQTHDRKSVGIKIGERVME